MKKIQKKTVLKPNKGNNTQINDEKKILNGNINENNTKISYQQKDSEQIEIISPNVLIKKDININSNEIPIEIKYNSNLNNKKNINKSEEGYLDSDLEDPENQIIYNNVIKRFEEKLGVPANGVKIPGSIESKKSDKIENNSFSPAITNKTKTILINEENNNYNNIQDNNSKNINLNKNAQRTTNYNTKYSNNKNSNKINYQNNNNNKNKYVPKINNNISYSYDINKKKQKEEKGKPEIRKKTIERGGKYNNIQITHIIYSKKNIDFHIIDPLQISNDNSRYKIKSGNKKNLNRNNSTGNFKISVKSSCDNITISPKKPNKGQTTIYYHCSQKNLKNINNKSVNNIRKEIYQTRNATNILSIPRPKYNYNALYKSTNLKK